MDTAQFVTSLPDGAYRCNACQWRCVLRAGDSGRCQMRSGTSEGITALNYGLISAASVGAIEEHRLWHFFPDSMVLTIGSWGYPFPADQQRGLYAQIPTTEKQLRRLDAERAANFALERLCRGVVWTHSEPAVAPEYVLELLQLSRAASRYTAISTSGFLTIEALDLFGPYLDGISLDLRGFSDSAYARLSDIVEWRGVLELASHARTRWQCHIEVTTRMHHGVNDDLDELRAMVQWIGTMLGPQTPWHLLPGDAGAATAAAVARARRLGNEGGLQFVYGPEPNQETRCPACQASLIVREAGVVRPVGLRDTNCGNCGTAIHLRNSIFRSQRNK